MRCGLRTGSRTTDRSCTHQLEMLAGDGASKSSSRVLQPSEDRPPGVESSLRCCCHHGSAAASGGCLCQC